MFFRGRKGVALYTLVFAVVVLLALGGVGVYLAQNKTMPQENDPGLNTPPAQQEKDPLTMEKGTQESGCSENQSILCPLPELPVCKEGKWMCIGPASGGGAGEAEENPAPSFTGIILAGTSAPLIDFNPTDYEAALRSNKLVVLYFYANWCPICKNEVQNGLYPAFNELASREVVGFRVNYKDGDTDAREEALARQFGVAYQHTKVFLKGGAQVLKAPDSWSKSRYLNEIQKAI